MVLDRLLLRPQSRRHHHQRQLPRRQPQVPTATPSIQIDEGYQYARGEYTTPDAALFPKGLGYIANQVRGDGLTFGVWTAPFEVSDRASIYQHHKDWLLHNAAGHLIHIGYVTDHNDPLFVLDTTNPGAQEYLRQTYQTLYDWGVRFIKMDFMDDTAVEGAYFRPSTTALEAQRIGLDIIRKTMGEDTVLDKDGSVMLNPVGLVDCGRISQDTGHTFDASRDAASGIAARYYMNRNFFIADPDAFTVSKQTVDDQSWHGGKHPLTLEEAKVSIALAAVAGGMFELGDDLPTLGASPERLALVKNPDLLNIARNGKSSTPARPPHLRRPRPPAQHLPPQRKPAPIHPHHLQLDRRRPPPRPATSPTSASITPTSRSPKSSTSKPSPTPQPPSPSTSQPTPSACSS